MAALPWSSQFPRSADDPGNGDFLAKVHSSGPFPVLLPWNLPFPAGSGCPPLTAGPFPSPRPALAALPSSPSFPLFAISLPVSDAYAAPSKCNSRICQNYFLKLPGRGGEVWMEGGYLTATNWSFGWWRNWGCRLSRPGADGKGRAWEWVGEGGRQPEKGPNTSTMEQSWVCSGAEEQIEIFTGPKGKKEKKNYTAPGSSGAATLGVLPCCCW